MIKSFNRQKKVHDLFEKTVKKFQNSIRLRLKDQKIIILMQLEKQKTVYERIL